MNKLEYWNGILKMFWACIIIGIFLGMCVYTKDVNWLWGVVVGGGFLGIKSLGHIAQALAQAAGGCPEDRVTPKNDITGPTDTRLAGMGGITSDVLKTPINALFNYGKVVVGIFLLIAIVFGGGSYIWRLNHKLTVAEQKLELTQVSMPDGVDIRASANRNNTTITYKDRQGRVKQLVVPHPKGSQPIVREVKDGEVKVNAIKELMPRVVVIPHFTAVVGPEIDAGVGVTVLRSEPLGVNGNVDVMIKSIGVSLTKDILDNSQLGLFYGFDYQGKNRIGIKYGVNF